MGFWMGAQTATATTSTSTTAQSRDTKISTSPTTHMHHICTYHLSKIYTNYTVYIRPRWKKIAEVDRSPPAIACHVSIMEGFNLTEAASGLKLDDHRMVTSILPNILNGWVTMLI